MDEKNNQQNKEHQRTCPYCKQHINVKTGINNWKNLFRKPTTEDWITLVILALLIMASYAYTYEMKQCKSMINNIEATCSSYTAWKLNLSNADITKTELPLTSNDTIGGEKS